MNRALPDADTVKAAIDSVLEHAAATGIHSQCIGLQAGGEANLMVATRSVADSGPAEPDTAVPRLRCGASRGLVPAEHGGAHTGRFCCSMYCLSTLSGAPPTVPAK
ncbi:hypothetical protein OK006_3045 [Actinobacteria bacterium OK006]|nr:hypothetical protein OK006_3045 [Actinobacteria bacterium OK006]